MLDAMSGLALAESSAVKGPTLLRVGLPSHT